MLKIIQDISQFTWKLKDLSFLSQMGWPRWGKSWQQVVQNCRTCPKTPSVKFKPHNFVNTHFSMLLYAEGLLLLLLFSFI